MPLIMIRMLVMSSFFFFFVSCSRPPVYPAPAVEGKAIVIDAGRVKPGKPEFFTFRDRDKNISFFVVKIDDKMLSFLDACAKCYPLKLGYKYESGGCIRCRKCNVKYAMPELEKGVGSCYPIKLAGRLQGERYIIDVSTLQSMADKF